MSEHNWYHLTHPYPGLELLIAGAVRDVRRGADPERVQCRAFETLNRMDIPWGLEKTCRDLLANELATVAHQLTGGRAA